MQSSYSVADLEAESKARTEAVASWLANCQRLGRFLEPPKNYNATKNAGLSFLLNL